MLFVVKRVSLHRLKWLVLIHSMIDHYGSGGLKNYPEHWYNLAKFHFLKVTCSFQLKNYSNFLLSIFFQTGFPKKIRGDHGTENILVARMVREVVSADAFNYGKSTSNQVFIFLEEMYVHNTCNQIMPLWAQWDFIFLS